MKNSETIKKPTGTLNLKCLDPFGNVLWQQSSHNLIVEGGYKATTQALAGVEGSHIKFVSIGTNDVEATESDTQIIEALTFKMQNVEFPSKTTVRFNFTIGYNDAIGMEIREFGLITADGRLFSRKVRAMIEKTQYMSIVGMWDINI